MLRPLWPALLVALCANACAPSGAGSKSSSSSSQCVVPSELCEKHEHDFVQAQAVVQKRCVGCHSPDGAAGPEHDFTVASTLQQRKRNVLGQLRSCSMPPPGPARLSAEERATLECWAMW